jgi:hypothetical protein
MSGPGKSCIYEVKFEFRWESAEPSHWESKSVRVCAGADAQEAVDKAKKATLAQHRLDENGKEERCSGFRLREVLLVAEADL